MILRKFQNGQIDKKIHKEGVLPFYRDNEVKELQILE